MAAIILIHPDSEVASIPLALRRKGGVSSAAAAASPQALPPGSPVLCLLAGVAGDSQASADDPGSSPAARSGRDQALPCVPLARCVLRSAVLGQRGTSATQVRGCAHTRMGTRARLTARP